MFNRKEILKKIKEIVLEVSKKYNVKVDKIILFGSRARGGYREDSDWDILVVIEEEANRNTIDNFWLKMERSLVKIGVSPEIIIVDKKTLEKYKDYTGYIYHHALTEGMVL